MDSIKKSLSGTWKSACGREGFVHYLFIDEYYIQITHLLSQDTFVDLFGRYSVAGDLFTLFVNARGYTFSCRIALVDDGVLCMSSGDVSIKYYKVLPTSINPSLVARAKQILKLLKIRSQGEG